MNSWEKAHIDWLIKVLIPYAPEVERYKERLRKFPGQADRIKRALVRKAHALGLDPTDNFHPHPRLGSLGDEGLFVGDATSVWERFLYGESEMGFLAMGAPKSGKTTAVCHYLAEAQQQGIGVLGWDLRGDYRRLVQHVPGAYLVPWEEDRINPFQPPPGMPLDKWMHVVSARLTHDLGLQLASQAWVIGILRELREQATRAGVLPTFIDFYELLKAQRPRPRSSEEGYWERVLSRAEALLDVCGEEVFAVQRGYPVTEEAEAGRLVMSDLRAEKFVADFLSSVRLYYLYYSRLYSPDPFSHRTVLVVLDEQRSLIRAQTHEFGIPDIELLFSRARALRIGFVIAEQVPSAVSSAVLTSCRLRLGFNSTQPEQLAVARLLGLNREQAEELSRLPKGECIARLAGDRIPGPFRLQVPLPEFMR